MRLFSVIIPTWNMGSYLKPLFESIRSSAFAGDVEEVIFVCEKSTDGSEEIIQKLAEAQGDSLPRVRIIQPERRRGLFVARYLGAQAALTDKIMYIDSRITLPVRTGQALPQLIRNYPAMCANVDIDIKKNIFCLYWQRSHETIFRSTYKITQAGVLTVTGDNYDQYRIGGTCFYCSRELFVKYSEKYLARPLWSDDTLLFKDLVHQEPFTVHPDYRILWEPRNEWRSFLKHLYIRGPGFAEYHFFKHRGWLFYAVLLALLYAVLNIYVLIACPLLGLALSFGALLALALSAALIVKSPKEFFRLAPLHVGVLIAYGIGSLRGAWMILRKKRPGQA